MKKIFKPTLLPLLTLICGLIGLGLRLWLFLSGIDEKGLLVEKHPAGILAFVLTAIFLLVLLLCVRTLSPVDKHQILFPARLLAGIGCAAAAVGILYVDIRDLITRQDTITIITLIVGVLAAAALMLLGFCRWKGKRPALWARAAVCVYFMLHLVSQYRLWSAESQLQVYFFPLMASVFLMLNTYHGAILDTEKNGSRRFYVFTSQAALFFCLLSLQGSSWPFYLTMALWMGTDLCSLKPYTSPEKEET